jgi:hypothetical protein
MIIEFIINKGVIVGLALLIGLYCFSLINLPIATIGFFFTNLPWGFEMLGV